MVIEPIKGEAFFYKGIVWRVALRHCAPIWSHFRTSWGLEPMIESVEGS